MQTCLLSPFCGGPIEALHVPECLVSLGRSYVAAHANLLEGAGGYAEGGLCSSAAVDVCTYRAAAGVGDSHATTWQHARSRTTLDLACTVLAHLLVLALCRILVWVHFLGAAILGLLGVFHTL